MDSITCYPLDNSYTSNHTESTPENQTSGRVSSTAYARPPSFSRRSTQGATNQPQRSALLDQHLREQARLHPFNDNSTSSSTLSSPFETPPGSPRSPSAKENPYYAGGYGSEEAYKRYGGLGGVEEEACANCCLSLPKEFSESLPDGFPGSPKKDGKGRNGSPTLRSKGAFMTYSSHAEWEEEVDWNGDWAHHDYAGKYTESPDELPTPAIHPSMTSSTSSSSPEPHTHTLTFLTSHNPPSPSYYSMLRRSCIRSLTCENLPRGSPSGAIMFGDPVAGYTIAYIFRLSDPSARGRRRSYALIALAGRDVLKAADLFHEISLKFKGIAESMTAMADQVSIAEAMHLKYEQKRAGNKDITPVSSFLSGRTVDPDGYPRRAGDIRAKGLPELVGEDNLFVRIHQEFVQMLEYLGSTHGGFSIPENLLGSASHTESEEVGFGSLNIS
ncbi:MAG: hypothetical protein M1827_000294 [Pycnora praestabilis]|nr:MAG: hypothetical protein M1827_000294 [Pycnora praestabilis]